MAKMLNFHFSLILVVVFALLLPYARSIDWPHYNGLCNKTFQDANATGVYHFKTQLGDEYTHAGWALTLLENDTSLQATRWFSPAGLNYSNDFPLGFDVCALEIEAVNNLTRYRGRSDDGSCQRALGQPCIDALSEIALSRANELTELTTPNLTTSALPMVCADLATAINDNFPKECKPYFERLSILGFPLTDHKDVNFPGCCGEFVKTSDGCHINQSETYTWYPLAEQPLHNGFRDHYDFFAREIYPTMTVYLPTVNYYRTNWIGVAHSKMTCLHVNHFNAGSRVVSPQPSPLPTKHHSLSAGDIAGIVVSCVVSVALFIGLFLWRWRKQRNRERLRLQSVAELDGSGGAAAPVETARPEVVEASTDTAISEANADWGFMRPTSGGEQMAEMPTIDSKTEMEKDEQLGERVHELPDSKK